MCTRPASAVWIIGCHVPSFVLPAVASAAWPRAGPVYHLHLLQVIDIYSLITNHSHFPDF